MDSNLVIEPINHHPSQIGKWFPYDGSRYKDVYDLKLKSGEVAKCMYPNGLTWYPEVNSNTDIEVFDHEVAEVMLTPDNELPEYRFSGQDRIDVSCALFHDQLPEIDNSGDLHD